MPLRPRWYYCVSVMTAPLRQCIVIYAIIAAATTPAVQAAKIVWCNATQGYSSTIRGAIEVLPPNTAQWARSDLECAAKCLLQQPSCLQMYYNFTTKMCYFMTSLSPLTLTNSTDGALLATPNDVYMKQPDYATYPVWINDCSTKFGGPMCLVDTSSCSQSPEIVNVRHYYLPVYEDDTDIGVMQAVNYRKLSGDTAVRVRWYATIRTFDNESSYCARYYVTFNGLECTNATTIDIVVADEIQSEHQRMAEIDGLCYGIPAGNITVAINVGPCVDLPLGNSFTGWRSSRSMWIWERKTVPIIGTSCWGLTYYNTQQYITRGISIVANVSSTNPEVELTSITYTKYSSTSSIAIKWTAITSVFSPANSTHCAKWYVTVNGTLCYQKIELMTAMLNDSFNSLRIKNVTRTMEGFCSGFPWGKFRIAIMVGPCFSNSTQPSTTATCCSNISQLIVSEKRFSKVFQAARMPDMTYEVLPFFNLVCWSWSQLNNSASSGAIMYSAYGKWSNISALHMRAVGNTRVLAAGGCCRWYFTIDGKECNQSGPIEAVQYTGRSVNYFIHGIVDGVCSGYPSGTRIVRLNVGNCPGYAVSSCASGWNATFQICVEEVHFEETVKCLNPLMCP